MATKVRLVFTRYIYPFDSLAQFSNFTTLSRGRALNTLHASKSKREAVHLMMLHWKESVSKKGAKYMTVSFSYATFLFVSSLF